MPRIFFSISGIAPPDVKRRPAHERILFWRMVVALGLRRKDWELSMGYNSRGNKMPPVKPQTAANRRSEMTFSGRGDPKAPYLTPGRAASRTRSLLTGSAENNRAVFSWAWDFHTRDEWGQILEYHRRRGKQYDVIGISPKGIAWVAANAAQQWRTMVGGAVTVPFPQAASRSVGASGVILQQTTPQPRLPTRALASPFASLMRLLLTALALGLALEAIRQLLGDDLDKVIAEMESWGLVSVIRSDDGSILSIAA